MSYTHNMNAEYRDVALEAREEVSEGRKEFLKLFGATGFSVLAAAALRRPRRLAAIWF